MNHQQLVSIHEFFDSYVVAFDQFNAKGIADHYAEHSQIIDNDGISVFSSRSFYRKSLRYIASALKILATSGQGMKWVLVISWVENGVFVDLDWQVTLAEDVLKYRTAYVLQRQQGFWQIGSAIVY